MLVQAISLVLAILLLIGLPGSLQATSVDRMTLRDMTAASTAIVHGNVISTTSRWNENRSLIVTDVLVQVMETLKGDAGGTVIVTQPGGQVGKIRVDVPGALAYRPGEEAVLFLRRGDSGRYSVAGISQGRIDVITNEATGRKQVRGVGLRESARLSSSASGTSGKSQGGDSLSHFLGEVRRLVLETGGKN